MFALLGESILCSGLKTNCIYSPWLFLLLITCQWYFWRKNCLSLSQNWELAWLCSNLTCRNCSVFYYFFVSEVKLESLFPPSLILMKYTRKNVRMMKSTGFILLQSKVSLAPWLVKIAWQVILAISHFLSTGVEDWKVSPNPLKPLLCLFSIIITYHP